MYIDEFKEYLETHSRAYEHFISKATDYQNRKNANRKVGKRWKDTKIEREAEKMWADMVKNVYDKIKVNGKFKKRYIHQEEIEDWITFMNEYDILDSFSDSIDELEFE